LLQKYYLKGVYRGKVTQSYGLETAINKTRVDEPLFLSIDGLEGDKCADSRYHGGAERALHQYPHEHYTYWENKYGKTNSWKAPGMGENLSSEGVTENTVCIGDKFRWGEAIVEISQPRSPCFKLNKRWGIESFSNSMQKINHCGWLYRVIQSGMVSVNEPLELIERAPNVMTVREVCDIFFGDPLNREKLQTLKQQTKLSHSWLRQIEQRLLSDEVENWNFRLLGHANTVA